MKTIEINLYEFNELSEEAQEKALNELWDFNVEHTDWWQYVYEDAENIGFKINDFDIDYRTIDGNFINDAFECANLIKNEHGIDCETFKTAHDFIVDRDNLVYKYSDKINTEKVSEENEDKFDAECDELENDFLHDLLNDYLIILTNEYEYLTSKDAIIETIKANEYLFTEDGKLY